MTTLSSQSGTSNATMALLWSRVQQRGDLPGFSKVVGAILAAMRGENDREFNMTRTVLSDPALTQKVLRLANSPMYAVFGSGINTVSKAVIVLGSDVIGHLALGLKLIEELSSASPDTRNARDEMEKALMAGHVARELASSIPAKDVEEAVVCSMLHSLGRMMVSFYLADQWALVAERRAESGIGEDAATKAVLGIGLVEIGRLTAERWGLPTSLVASLQEVVPSHGSEPLDHIQWLATISTASTRCAEVLHQDAPSATEQIAKLAQNYAEMLGMETSQMMSAVNSAEMKAVEEDIFVRPSMRARKARAKAATNGKPANSAALLKAGVADLREAAGNLSLVQQLTMALEVIYKGLGLTRAIVFSHNADEARYAARMHFGNCSPDLIMRLVLGDAYAPDVFHAALATDKMIFVADPHESAFSNRLPSWWMENLGSAHSFIVLPLMVNHHSVGFVYGDWDRAVPKVTIDPAEIGLLNELRVLAIQGITDWRRLEAGLEKR